MSQFQHVVNVEGVVRKGDQLLTVIRSEAEAHAGGTLSFIGGKVEFNGQESGIVEATLKREILEEVGATVTNLRYVTSTGFMADDEFSVVNLLFLCDWESGEPYAVDPDEVAAVHWMTADEIKVHPKTPPWILSYTFLIEALIANE